MFTTAAQRAIYDRMDALNAELSAVYGEFWEYFRQDAQEDPRAIEYAELVFEIIKEG